MNAVVVLILQQEIPIIHVPGDVAVVGHDLAIRWRSDEAVPCFLEISLIGKRQDLTLLLLRFDRILGRHFSLRIEMLQFLG